MTTGRINQVATFATAAPEALSPHQPNQGSVRPSCQRALQTYPTCQQPCPPQSSGENCHQQVSIDCKMFKPNPAAYQVLCNYLYSHSSAAESQVLLIPHRSYSSPRRVWTFPYRPLRAFKVRHTPLPTARKSSCATPKGGAEPEQVTVPILIRKAQQQTNILERQGRRK